MIIGKNILRSRMTKLEEAACKWADARCPEQGPEFIVWCMCFDDYMAGALELLEQAKIIAYAPDNGMATEEIAFCEKLEELCQSEKE